MKNTNKIRKFLWIMILSICMITGCNVSDKKEDSSTEMVKMDGTLQVHFIDVGQGDATLITCGNESMLVDAGNNDSGTRVWKYLLDHNVEELKYVIGTHPDADHVGGLDVVISKFAITSGEIWLPDFQNETKTMEELYQTISYFNIKEVHPNVGDTYTLGDAILTIYGPTKGNDNSNDNSIVIGITYGNVNVLLTGDASAEEEQQMIEMSLPQFDVIKIAHHGSKYSTSKAFLDELSPKYGVISVGENNYGHPSAEVLNRLRTEGISLYRTDEQGTILLETDGTKLIWNTSPTESWQANEPEGSSAEETMVWVTANGNCYHKDKECSNMKNPIQISLEKAVQSYRPCQKCFEEE